MTRRAADAGARGRAAAVCGGAAAVWALAVPGVAACRSDGYSHVSQFISELGATGAEDGALGSIAYASLRLLRADEEAR